MTALFIFFQSALPVFLMVRRSPQLSSSSMLEMMTNAAEKIIRAKMVSIGNTPRTRASTLATKSTNRNHAQMSAKIRTLLVMSRHRLMRPSSPVHLFSRGQGHTCTLGLQSCTVTYTGSHCTLVTTSISYAFRQIVPRV